jgi:hypothetical protein
MAPLILALSAAGIAGALIIKLALFAGMRLIFYAFVAAGLILIFVEIYKDTSDIR